MTFEHPRRWLLAAAVCAPLCMGAEECTTVVVGAKTTCDYGGKSYEVGERYPSTDGCNECTCGADGQSECTLRGCLSNTCEYGGTTYAEGENFPASDGCNTCVCADGNVACTDIACEAGCEHKGKHYALGQTFNDGCAGCACTPDGVVCDAILCDPGEPGDGCTFGDASFPVGSGVICPDGCNSCGCNETPEGPTWAQTLIGCPPLRQVEICSGGPNDAAARAYPLYVSGDALALRLEFGGGCEEHAFRLCTDGALRESFPVQLSLWVVDDGKPDPCDAWLTQEHVFDLSPLRALYEQNYGTKTGAFSLGLNEGSVTYSW